ncbi:hypothetical protein Ndes2526B_g05594 [Nannochloris sp. 'desiccata']
MESGARPPFLTPHEPLPRSFSSEDVPVWEPSEQTPRPPPLPCPAYQPSVRALTTNQYKELSLLPTALQQGVQNAAPLPLLPIELPSVRKMVAAGHASDSEGAVTSRIEAQKLAVAAAKAAAKAPRAVLSTDAFNLSKETPEAEELTSLLEDTLGEEELENRNHREENETQNEGDGKEREEEEEIANRAIQHENIEIDLSNDPGTGSIKQRATQTALKATGYESWEAFTTELSKNAATTIAAAAANANAVAKNALERKEAAKRKAEQLEEHSSLVPRWSSVSAADHTWYLKHEGHQLIGADAERYATLAAKFEAEKLEYWAAVEAEARAHPARYQHIVDLSIENRSAVITSCSGGGGGGSGGQSTSSELFPLEKELLRLGEAPTLLQLPSGTNLPGSKLYLPAQISEQAGPRPGEAGAVYRKACAAALWEDSNLATALQKSAKILENEEANSEVIVCATSGAMLCLLRSSLLNHSPAWHIPVFVESAASPARKRKIYLSKPILTEKETLRVKQQRIQKYAIITEGLASDPSHRPKPSNAAPGPRERMYWLTLTGPSKGERLPLCIRTHGRVLIESKREEATEKEKDGEEEEEGKTAPLLPPRSLSAVLAVSTDYLPEPDIEQDAPNELATWWAKLALTPRADTAAVAHVRVPSNRMIDWKLWSQKDIASKFGNTLDIETSAKSTIDTIMESLKDLEPGKYLLKHDAAQKSVQILQEEEEHTVQATGEKAQDVYDLHASQATAGEIDTSIDSFIPPKWRPYREDVAQVPFTFPPEVHGGRGQGRGGGGGKGGSRKRQRNNPWQGDLDQVQHVATISRSEYAAQLLEETVKKVAL